MTPHVLNGAFERVTRADKHLTELESTISAWRFEQESAIIPQFEAQFPHHFLPDVSRSVGPPLVVGILIGEICYNLRSALDYLIFELSIHDSGIEPSNTQFPIEDSKDGFTGRATTVRLKGINPRHIAMIECLQPYKGCDWTKTLRDISNPDKHRELAGITGTYQVRHSFPDHADFLSVNRPIRRVHHPIRGEVEVKIQLTSPVALRDGSPIPKTLEVIKLQVAETLTAFKSEF